MNALDPGQTLFGSRRSGGMRLGHPFGRAVSSRSSCVTGHSPLTGLAHGRLNITVRVTDTP